MGRTGAIAAAALLAAGCLSAPGSSSGAADAALDAGGEPGTTLWQVPLGTSLPYLAIHDGELVVAAGFSGALAVDPPVTAEGDADLLVARFDRGGAQRFAAAYGGPAAELPTALAVSPAGGDIAVLGLYSGGEARLAGDPLPDPVAPFNVFVARYDRDGAPVWSTHGSADDGLFVGSSLSMSGAGHLAFAGDYSSNLVLAEGSVIFAGPAPDLYLARVSAAGRLDAGVGFGGTGEQAGAAAVFDGLGSLYLVGTTDAPLAVGALTADGDADGALFVARTDESGEEVSWVIDTNGGSVGRLRAAATPDGNLLLTGWFEGLFSFGDSPGEELVSRGGSDVFIALIAPDGTLLWLQHFGGIGDDEAAGLAVGPDGSFAVCGAFRAEAALAGGEGQLLSAGSADGFVLSFDPAGQLRWARGFGDAEDDLGLSVAVDADGGVALAARFRGEVDFGGPEPLASGGGDAAALVRFR